MKIKIRKIPAEYSYLKRQAIKSIKRFGYFIKQYIVRREIDKLRELYRIPKQGLKSEESIKHYKRFKYFESDIIMLRNKFNLSSRWQSPLSDYVITSKIDAGIHYLSPVCGLDFYMEDSRDPLLLVNIFGDTTEKEYRESWQAIKKLQRKFNLRDKEQLRYSSYILDRLIVKSYNKLKNWSKVSDELQKEMVDNIELYDQCGDTSYLKMRHNRALNRHEDTDVGPKKGIIRKLKGISK